MKKSSIPLAAQIIGTVFFVAALLGVMTFFVNVFDAAPYKAPFKLDRNYDRSAMQAALSTNAVAARYETIAGFGSRAPGQPGCVLAHDAILAAFTNAGLEVYTQDVDIPYPLTNPGSGFIAYGGGSNATQRVWPFAPNYAQPVTTGKDGVEGVLFLATEENIRACKDFRDKIAVIDTSLPVFSDLGYAASQYAELGFKAIVLTHAEGLSEVPWQKIEAMVIKELPINIVRVAAEPAVLSHIGEKARIDARSSWKNVRTESVIGLLRAEGRKNDDLLIVPVTYDAQSMIPDMANSSVEALQTAILLQTVEGLLPHRAALQRDVAFVAVTGVSQTQQGYNRLISTMGKFGRNDDMRVRIEADIADNGAKARMLREIRGLFDDPGFATAGHAAESDAALKTLPKDTRKFFSERLGAVLRRSVFVQAENLLQAQIAYRRNPDDLTTPEYHRFRVEKKRYDDLNNLSALPLARALERPVAKTAGFVCQDGSTGTIRDAILANVDYLLGYHADVARSLEKDLALQKLFASYSSTIVISPRINPSTKPIAHETVSYGIGYRVQLGEASSLFRAMLDDSVYALGLSQDVTVKGTDTYAYGGVVRTSLDSNPFAVCSYPAFSLLCPQNTSPYQLDPMRQASVGDLSTVADTLQIFGEVVISAARGYGNFPRLGFMDTYAMCGGVYAAGIGNSVVPNYPVENALVCSLDTKPKTFTDPYGQYRQPFLIMPAISWQRYRPFDTFFYDEEGMATHVKDYGKSAQNIYASSKITFSGTPVNLILYRASPVALLNCINPQSMKAYTGISFISRNGLGAFASTCPYTSPSGQMDFIPPQEYFFLTLKAGAPDNELVAQTRAFCLGTTHTNEPSYKPSDNEIDGAGYLAQDTPIFRDIAREAAISMDYLADKRLELQKKYGMADEMTLTFDQRAKEIVADDDAHAPERPLLARLRSLRQGLSYLILNHPTIRGSVSEAVWGILWYMGLLVPFIFFFEKLVFGFSDVRKQILAEGAIFLVVFLLLRILHPAFHMIRSSAMILLGFVIIIVVGSVTLVLSSKFQENIDALRKAQGAVKGASGNKMGIIMTAFMLGLNNMHKRKVRTGLTCATLVLMTFVMICFTSVQSNVVEKERAIGRAAYQGLLVREKQFRPISDSEIAALKASYGENYTINVRRALLGMINFGDGGQVTTPDFPIVRGEGEKANMAIGRVGLSFDETEPLAPSIKMLTTNGWFTAAHKALNKGPYPILLPDTIAEQLGIFPEEVNAGPVAVTIAGSPYFVHGIFDSASFEEVVDVDGENLLPFDITAISRPQLSGGVALADPTDPRVPAGELIIGLNGQMPGGLDGRAQRAVSVVVDMGKAPYATARKEITSYLEQTSREADYGLDGTAFNGRRARFRSMAGLADLLIPLIIAALTVLNTMKGSVYERRDEIFVYNAVGIAPRYVFFMFVAEALVYSVVGAVLGYILSQGTGRILTALDWTGGMNMNFTSITTIYASIAIALATLASTYFPARSAMEIAKPADNAGWSLPKPSDDDMITTDLPFTFTKRDRIAVLAFFYNYFENYGEGSAGPFFSGQPKLTIADHTDDLADGAYIPCLDVQVWLKPFDLGVSQRIVIELATDPDTKEYVSKMKLIRVTGTHDAWLRLNGPLVANIRQHFLHWRAVPAEDKGGLFDQARKLLEETVLGENA